MRCTTSPTIILALAAVTFVACGSDDRDNNGTTKPKDGGFSVPDTGVAEPDGGITTPDTGTQTCDSNPMGCVANQLKGAPPTCACLQACSTGFTWNAAANRCDVAGNPDGGTPDGGNNPDTGVGTDAGTPDSGIVATACTTNANCMAGEECIQPQNGDLCAGQQDCICLQACTPNQATSTCPVGEACLWLFPGTRGLCVGETGTQAHGQPCQAMYNGTQLVGDNCLTNHYCWGASSMNPTGVCSRFCPPGNNTVCAAAGNFTCTDVGQTPGQIGLCFDPVPAFNDVGNSCTANPNCMGNLCSQILAGSCSYACDGLAQCPTGSVCLNAPQEGPICVSECTFGAAGDTFCSGRNPMTICETLGTAPNTVDVCIPRCTQDAECGTTTCNTTTGHCN